MSKEIYVPVDRIAHKVTKVYAPVNGVARGVKKVYKGVNGIARLVFDAGKNLAELAVGESVFININSKPVEFIVVNRGIPENSPLYDSSCDGIWLLMKNIYRERKWEADNVNDYKNSDIHAYLNGDFLALFDHDVQSAIKQVKIPYVNGTGSNGPIASQANGLSSKVFLPSMYELGLTTSDSSFILIDGACLEYFKGSSTSDRVAYLGKNETGWWTRTPSKSSTNMVFGFTVDGSIIRPTADGTYGVRPLLILPYTAKFDPATNTIK